MKRRFPLRPGAITIALSLVLRCAYGSPGDLYVAEPTGGGHVYKFTANGDRSTVASGMYQPISLAFDRSGNLFVGNSGSCGCIPETTCDCPPATIIKITPDGTQSTFATLSSPDLSSLAFDSAGNVFVSTGLSILKITPTGAQSTFASHLPAIGPLAFDYSDNLYAGSSPTGACSIVKFTPDGNMTTFVTFGGGSTVTALAFGGGGDLFAMKDSSILRISPNHSTKTFATSQWRFTPASLAFDAAGNLFAGQNAYNSTEPAILKFAPDGTSTVFASGVLLPSAFAFEPVTEKMRNLSARGLVAGDDNTLISGFIVGGNALSNNALIVRALGPSLAGGGVKNPLSDPVLELHDSSGATIASNNDWQDTQKAQITASGIAPPDPRESAIFATLPVGNYTAVVLSGNNASGTAVVEVYSVSQ